MDQKRLRLGIAGLGRAFSLMLPTLAGDARIQIVAGADPRAEAHMAAAMRLLIANHEWAGRQTDAARFRETAVRQFSLRPALLDVKKPVGQP